jgi:hypothetical protein
MVGVSPLLTRTSVIAVRPSLGLGSVAHATRGSGVVRSVERTGNIKPPMLLALAPCGPTLTARIHCFAGAGGCVFGGGSCAGVESRGVGGHRSDAGNTR